MTFLSEISPRQQIASRYLSGEGIEIGALHSPLELPPGVKIRYLDRIPNDQLRQQYPELAECNLVELDIIEDGETLASLLDASLDFVIANHMVEHCQDPISSLKNWLRVLKTGGILYLAVLDKRYTFDCDRPVTPLEHIIRDHTEGPRWSMNYHFEERTRLVDKVPEENVAVRTKYLAMEIELLQKNSTEFIVILKKTV